MLITPWTLPPSNNLKNRTCARNNGTALLLSHIYCNLCDFLNNRQTPCFCLNGSNTRTGDTPGREEKFLKQNKRCPRQRTCKPDVLDWWWGGRGCLMHKSLLEGPGQASTASTTSMLSAKIKFSIGGHYLLRAAAFCEQRAENEPSNASELCLICHLQLANLVRADAKRVSVKAFLAASEMERPGQT